MKKSKQNSKNKKLQAFSAKLESQKLLNVLNKNNDYKISVNVKIMLSKHL